METILQGLNWDTCLIYLDDVMVFSPTLSHHLTHLAKAFDRLRQANIKLKPSKCNFGCKKGPVSGTRSHT